MQPKSEKLLGAGIVAGILAADQLSKFLVNKYIGVEQGVSLIGSFLMLVHTKNTGIAFGFFRGANLLMIFVVLAIITALFFALRGFYREGDKFSSLAACIVMGGAFGNLFDRIFFGRITDFIVVGINGHYWPNFNVADSCISIGGVLLAYSFAFRKKTEPQKNETTDAH